MAMDYGHQPVEVRVLGPVELVDGTAAVRLRRAERTLLAALAARVGQRVSMDTLEEALWPAVRPPSSRKSLQVHIVRLRRSLGSSSIVEVGGGYRLDADLVAVDAERVAELLAAAREAIRSCAPDEVADLLAEARAAFRGEPYEGVAESALPAGEVQRLQQLRAAIVEEGFEADLTAGRGDQCVAALEAFVQVNPYRERAWGQLMRALYQAGRPADALAAFGRARIVLAAELGIEPGPVLRQVEQAILTHDSDLLAPVAAPTRLGLSNLPAALGPIIGRQLELAELESLLVSERLVTLTGVGGIGKTRLAIELAAHIAGKNRFGPFFVDLAPIAEVGLVPVALAASLGIRVEPTDDVIARLSAVLADHHVVIVVDNCEHLLPGIAELLATLLSSSPHVRVIATSREQLGVAGERVCPVDPLRVPAADSTLEQIATSDAAVLFLARLPTNLTTGPLSPNELAAVGAICRSLAGIPLGLELAAARSRTLSLPELAGRLVRSINEPTPSRHAGPSRHHTMRAALAWGYRLLTPPAQQALRAMSVFAGGCDLAAFTTVCHDDDAPPVDDVLDELVRTSFVTVDFTAEPTRYRLLEPVRQFAGELLDDNGVASDRHRRHLEHYLEVARSCTRDVDGFGQTEFDVLRAELGNFRAALDWAASSSEAIDAGLWLASRLWELWNSDANHEEGLTRLVGLLDGGAGSAAARSEAAYRAGFIVSYMGDDEQAIKLLEQALDDAVAGCDRPSEARARLVLAAFAYLLRGDVAGARQHIDTALRIATADAHVLLHGWGTLESARLYQVTGSLDQAIMCIDEVLGGPAGGLPSIEMNAHAMLGEILQDQGAYAEARIAFERALALAESEHNLSAAISVHLKLAPIDAATGKLNDASAHIATAEELHPDTAHSWEPVFQLARADLALARGRNAEALACAEAAATIETAVVQRRDFRNYQLRCLGDSQLALGRADDALITYQQLIARAGAAHHACRLADGYEGAAAATFVLGNSLTAFEHLATANDIRQRTNSRRLPRLVVDHILNTLVAAQPADAYAEADHAH
jgi:predicted ATPase/DNA-binding SARP family transcriptional activator